MDAIGFVFATAFLATVFTIFGIIGRIIDGVADGLRYTVAPAMISGFTAWGDRRAAGAGTAGRPAEVAAHDDARDDATDVARPPEDAVSEGLVVPVQGLGRRDPS